MMICFMKLDLDWLKEDGKGAVHECNVNCRIAGHRRTKSLLCVTGRRSLQFSVYLLCVVLCVLVCLLCVVLSVLVCCVQFSVTVLMLVPALVLCDS